MTVMTLWTGLFLQHPGGWSLIVREMQLTWCVCERNKAVRQSLSLALSPGFHSGCLIDIIVFTNNFKFPYEKYDEKSYLQLCMFLPWIQMEQNGNYYTLLNFLFGFLAWHYVIEAALSSQSGHPS